MENRENGAHVRIDGNDNKAVGALKVRAESLAAGQSLMLSHHYFSTPGGAAFLQQTMDSTGVFIRFDYKIQSLRAYGSPGPIEDARDRIRVEVDRLAALDYSIPLKNHLVRFFVEQGVPALREELGEGAVTLNLSSYPRRITIHASEDGRFLLDQLLQEASNSPADKGKGKGKESASAIFKGNLSYFYLSSQLEETRQAEWLPQVPQVAQVQQSQPGSSGHLINMLFIDHNHLKESYVYCKCLALVPMLYSTSRSNCTEPIMLDVLPSMEQTSVLVVT